MSTMTRLKELKFELESVKSEKAKSIAIQTLPQINMMLKKYEQLSQNTEMINNIDIAVESYLNDENTSSMIGFIKSIDK